MPLGTGCKNHDVRQYHYQPFDLSVQLHVKIPPRASPQSSRKPLQVCNLKESANLKGRDFASVLAPAQEAKLWSNKMEKMSNLLSRFDSMVENCSTEMRNLNECYLNSDSSSSACSNAQQNYIACETRMKSDLAAVNKACGSQHAEYTSCMSNGVEIDFEKCNLALQSFVTCSEVFCCTHWWNEDVLLH